MKIEPGNKEFGVIFRIRKGESEEKYFLYHKNSQLNDLDDDVDVNYPEFGEALANR